MWVDGKWRIGKCGTELSIEIKHIGTNNNYMAIGK